MLMDVHTFEESQETMALLQLLAIGTKEIEAGETYLLKDVIGNIRSRRGWKPDQTQGPKTHNGNSTATSKA